MYLLVTDNMATYISTHHAELNHGGAVHAVNAVDGQLQGLSEVKRFIPRHQLQALTHLSVVEASIDSGEHKVSDTAHSACCLDT